MIRPVALAGCLGALACGGSTSSDTAATGPTGAGGTTSGAGGATSGAGGTTSGGGGATSGAGGTTSGAGGATSGAAGSGGSAGAPGFPASIDGIWLIGWSGGLNHHSWVRLSGAAAWGGDADYLPGDDIDTNAPYWSCSGKGTWTVTAKPDTISLSFPTACAKPSAPFTFTSITTTTGFPMGADAHATLDALGNPGGPAIDGFHFPPSQCDAAMTTCGDPFGF